VGGGCRVETTGGWVWGEGAGSGHLVNGCVGRVRGRDIWWMVCGRVQGRDIWWMDGCVETRSGCQLGTCHYWFTRCMKKSTCLAVRRTRGCLNCITKAVVVSKRN